MNEANTKSKADSMKTRKLLCIVCPNCCRIEITCRTPEAIASIEGAQCQQGEEFAIEEVRNPRRMFTGSVYVKDGNLPLTSVKTSAPVHRKYITELGRLTHELEVSAPVEPGDIVARNVLGQGVELVATRRVERAGRKGQPGGKKGPEEGREETASCRKR